MTTPADWRSTCLSDIKGGKGFALSTICLASIAWIVTSAIRNRDSLMFWFEWERTALIATGIGALAFWLAAFLWPPQHFERTSWRTAGKFFCFVFAVFGSLLMLGAGLIATLDSEYIEQILTDLQKGLALQETDSILEAMADGIYLQSLCLSIGMLLLCLTEMMFLWGIRKANDEEAKRLRQDYGNCLKFSDGPCFVVFTIILISIALAANKQTGHMLLILYKVFVAGAVALQVTLSNLVFSVEFAEGPRSYFKGSWSLLRLPYHFIRWMHGLLKERGRSIVPTS